MSFKSFIRQSNNARKIFGKKEIEIILKQMDGIKLTQSEKNRLSRDIRPKFKFMDRAYEFRDDFDLKRNSHNKNVIDSAVKQIRKDELNKDIRAVWLFGSHVTGEITRRSDIDICIIFSDISPKDAARFRIRIMSFLPDKVDVQVFNVLPQKIKREIAKSHNVLYERKDFDHLLYSILYMKDEDYFIRMKRIFSGVEA